MATEATLPRVSEFPPLGSYELIKVVEAGLPVETLELLRERGLTFTEVGQLVIPPRTVKHRKARGERLTTEETERLLRVLRVLEHGERVFGDREKLLAWLRAPEPELGDRPSMSVIGDDAGAQLVEAQLWGLADGVYS